MGVIELEGANVQIDFHHGVMYVLSRLAGFNTEEANIISYCSQYVDDAINGGFIKFKNHPMFYRISTAHGMLDTRNTDEQANQHSWLPFHFLPGNEAGNSRDLGFVARLICRQNSDLAKEMVTECISKKNDYNGLHRLGITMHVYADTWAHQGFAGIKHEINKVQNLSDDSGNDLVEKIIEPLEGAVDHIKSLLIDNFPLGHGAALSCPDQPYLIWEYKNHFGEYIPVNNLIRFMGAVDNVFVALQRYKLGDATAAVPSIPQDIRAKMEALFKTNYDDVEWARNRAWLNKIEENYFGFGAEKVQYIPKGPGSWKHSALGTTKEKDDAAELFEFRSEFLDSDWKKFHESALDHWKYVMFKLLPSYGIIL